MTKLTYVSRIHPRDHLNHVILGVVGNKPNNFAAQINLNTTNMWEIVKSIVDLCMKLNEGKYALVKDPSKPLVRIYEVPVDAFENDWRSQFRKMNNFSLQQRALMVKRKLLLLCYK
jgi:translation initiation factor 3 subunit D